MCEVNAGPVLLPQHWLLPRAGRQVWGGGENALGLRRPAWRARPQGIVEGLDWSCISCLQRFKI